MTSQTIVCPGCGLALRSANTGLDGEFNASAACRELCYQLWYYTLSLGDPYFIHQLAVDAYAAQHVDKRSKPIAATFALVGLYLVWERGFTGKQVQNVHVALGRQSKEWPLFPTPPRMASLTVQDVVQAPDEEKTAMIKRWHHSVWEIWRQEEEQIAGLLRRYLGL